MKKRFNKSLALNKKTISRLQNDEMSKIKGAVSILYACTESCSALVACCGPTAPKENYNIDLEKARG